MLTSLSPVLGRAATQQGLSSVSPCFPGALHSAVQNTPETFGEVEETKHSVLLQTVRPEAAHTWGFSRC